jgi:adenosylhomocysteinase
MPAFVLAEKYVKSRARKVSRPFDGLKLAACLHISKETSVLVNSLRDLGFEITLAAANPLSSQDEISAFLLSQGVDVLGHKGETTDEYQKDILRAARASPDLIIDDGGVLHFAYASYGGQTCFGGTDETTTGTTRLRALDLAGKLRYPVIPVNEASTKHIFDNKYGTGQSSVDGLIRATGLLVAGKTVVVAGYGWVGQGVAMRLRGMGAKIIVTEVNPVKALEAHLVGFTVLPMKEAVVIADIVLTCTGQINVLSAPYFGLLKDGAIIGNLGHFGVEIDVKKLFYLGRRIEQLRPNVTKIELAGQPKKSVLLLCQGRVINLAAAEGHPPEIMQLSFANQLLSIHYLVVHRKELSRSKSKLSSFPAEIDSIVADLALKGFNLKIDRLSSEQSSYAHSV